MQVLRELRIVFDSQPGPEGPRFIECHDADDKGVSAGEWRSRPDGYWELVITQLPIVDRRTDEEKELEFERNLGV